MKQINCLIVDDEPRAHEVLKIFIDRVHTLSLAGNCYNTCEAYEFISSNKIDLIFLDINMPEADGFSLLELTKPVPLVIITTAYGNHAVKSYEYDVTDFLLKPISFERFLIAIDKATKRRNTLTFENSQHNQIEIKVDGKVVKIDIATIKYVEALGNYVRFVTTHSTIVTYCTIKNIESKLLHYKFARIHKSFMVNISAIESVNENSISISSALIPIGKTYKKYVTHLLKFQT